MELSLTEAVEEILEDLASGKKRDAVKAKKVAKALRLLSDNPQHPGLNSHRYDALDGEVGETVWESYVENNTPSAWRIWWFDGPGDEVITVVDVGPHP